MMSAPSSPTFPNILAHRAATSPDRRAFVFLSGNGNVVDELSYGGLYARAGALACDLDRRGLRQARVLIALPSGLDFVVAFYACLLAGVIAVPIPYIPGRQAEKRVKAVSQNVGAAAVLTLSGADAELDALLHEEACSLPRVYIDQPRPAMQGDLPAVSSDAVAFIQYTSGSTSTPKGVMLTNGNLIANCEMITQAFGDDEDSRGVGWLPLFHDMGLIGHVLQPVYIGALSVLMSPLTFLQRPLRWLEAISTWKATTSGGPSYAFELCLRMMPENLSGLDLSAWAVAYSGAEPVHRDVLERFARRLEPCGFRAQSLQPCYGLAEATLLVTSTSRADRLTSQAAESGDALIAVSNEVVSCGRSWGESLVSITDSETGAPLPDGRVGEINVQGPHVSPGYWTGVHSGEAPTSAPPSPRILNTGDLGFLRDGDLYVVGRTKDTVIVLGRKHVAEDIEATIRESDPAFAFAPAAVFAVEIDGREHAVAIQEVVPRRLGPDQGRQAQDAAFAAVTRDHGLRLYDLMLVKSGVLPRTSSGKVQRAIAKVNYLNRNFDRIISAPGFAGITSSEV